jgi:hypothetical protein
MRVVQVLEYLQRALPGLVRRRGITGLSLGVTEVGEDQSPVPAPARAEIDRNIECLLVTARGLGVIAEAAVRVSQYVPGVRLSLPLSSLALQVERPSAKPAGVLIASELAMKCGQGGQGQPLAVGIAGLAEEFGGVLGVHQALIGLVALRP